MPELWDLYDVNRTPLGRTHERGKPMNDGEFHLVVEILLADLDGNCLITKRHPDKPHGNMWEWSGGSVVAGENSLDGAIRELSEETGINVTKDEISYKGTVVTMHGHTIYDVYFAQKAFTADEVVLQDGETVDYKMVTIDEVREMVTRGEFLDFEYFRHRVAWGDEIKLKQE